MLCLYQHWDLPEHSDGSLCLQQGLRGLSGSTYSGGPPFPLTGGVRPIFTLWDPNPGPPDLVAWVSFYSRWVRYYPYIVSLRCLFSQWPFWRDSLFSLQGLFHVVFVLQYLFLTLFPVIRFAPPVFIFHELLWFFVTLFYTLLDPQELAVSTEISAFPKFYPLLWSF